MSPSERSQVSYDSNHEVETVEFTAEVRRQVQRILRSSLFSKSPQAARLLSFLVDQTLSPPAESSAANLKEYSIAVRVFGRPTEFDPTVDNIVRVEVRRVRSKLEAYYQGDGLTEPLVISIPKGAYVPLFSNPGRSRI